MTCDYILDNRRLLTRTGKCRLSTRILVSRGCKLQSDTIVFICNNAILQSRVNMIPSSWNRFRYFYYLNINSVINYLFRGFFKGFFFSFLPNIESEIDQKMISQLRDNMQVHWVTLKQVLNQGEFLSIAHWLHWTCNVCKCGADRLSINFGIVSSGFETQHSAVKPQLFLTKKFI